MIRVMMELRVLLAFLLLSIAVLEVTWTMTLGA